MPDMMRWEPETHDRHQLSSEKFLKDFRQFSRGKHHPLELLVREMAQNTIDASAGPGAPTLEFSIEWREGDEWVAIAEGVGGRTAGRLGAVRVLLVRDRGTRGLGGPVRSTVSEKRGDYLGMISTTSSSSKQGGSGGSFGLGRSLLFLLSQTATVLIDSVHEDENGVLVRRIIGMRLLDDAGRAECNRILAHKNAESAPAAGPLWWTPAGLDPLEGRLDDPSSPVNVLGRKMDLRHPAERAAGTDLYIVDFVNDVERETESAEEDKAGQDREAAGVLYAAAAASLFQCVVEAGDITRNLEKVTVRTKYGVKDLDEKAISTDRTLWPVRHLAEAYRKTVADGSKGGVMVGHTDRTPYGNPADADEALRKVQPFSSLAGKGRQDADVFDSSEGVALILPSRQSSRIVLDPWYGSHGSGSAGLPLKVEPGRWKVGILLVAERPGLADRMRNTENEAHTQWRRSIEKNSWSRIDTAADSLARSMGVVTQENESESDVRLTRWGQKIGSKFTLPGRAPGGPPGPPGPPGPSGGQIPVDYVHDFVSHAGREYHLYELRDLKPGTTYEVSAREHNLVGSGEGLEVLDASGKKVESFVASSGTFTVMVERSAVTGVEFKAEEL